MSIPDFQNIMLPFLKTVSDGKECALRDIRLTLASQFGLTETERLQTLGDGRQRVFDNRVSWAKAYLQMAGLINATKYGHFVITDEGISALKTNPPKIDIKFLNKYPAFLETRKGNKKASVDVPVIDETTETPHEVMDKAYLSIRQDLIEKILEHINGCSPKFFEELVFELLKKMGYGKYGEVTGKAGDEGIDAYIKEDILGLDVIYLQAKRWKGNVGRPEVQKFVGALHGKKAKKGVFITTSAFPNEAIEYASSLENKVVLIDGQQLAEYMIDFNIGVTTTVSYEIKRVDIDFFTEE
jgi:restriction system protein